MVIEMTLVFSTIPEGSKVECCLSQRSYSTSFATSMSSRVSSECCPLLCPMFQCAHSKKPLELSMMQPEATLLVSQSRHFRRGKSQQGYRNTRLQNGHWCYVIPFNENHTWMFLDSSMWYLSGTFHLPHLQYFYDLRYLYQCLITLLNDYMFIWCYVSMTNNVRAWKKKKVQVMYRSLGF